MPGQLVDVTGLRVTHEESEVMDPYESENILNIGETFHLTLAFEGTGMMWRNLCNNEVEFEARYYAEGYGTVPDIDLGVKTGNLSAGKFIYDFDDDRTTLQVAGGIDPTPYTDAAYKLAAVLKFPGWDAVLGHTEGPIIQIGVEG